jgi:RecJ-like exonuclease
MQLVKCKSCKHFVSMIQSDVVCSYNNAFNQRPILSNNIVDNCPLSETDSYETMQALGEKIACKVCKGSGNISETDNVRCSLCNGNGNLTETASEKEIKIPHLAEFRIKAIRIKDKYKIIMTTDGNGELVSQTKELELDNSLYNQIFVKCKNLLENQ